MRRASPGREGARGPRRRRREARTGVTFTVRKHDSHIVRALLLTRL